MAGSNIERMRPRHWVRYKGPAGTKTTERDMGAGRSFSSGTLGAVQGVHMPHVYGPRGPDAYYLIRTSIHLDG